MSEAEALPEVEISTPLITVRISGAKASTANALRLYRQVLKTVPQKGIIATMGFTGELDPDR